MDTGCLFQSLYHPARDYRLDGNRRPTTTRAGLHMSLIRLLTAGAAGLVPTARKRLRQTEPRAVPGVSVAMTYRPGPSTHSSRVMDSAHGLQAWYRTAPIWRISAGAVAFGIVANAASKGRVSVTAAMYTVFAVLIVFASPRLVLALLRLRRADRVCLLFGMFSVCVALLAQFYFGRFSTGSDTVSLHEDGTTLQQVMLLLVVGPFAETLFFQGAVQSALEQFFGRNATSMLFAAAVFLAAHLGLSPGVMIMAVSISTIRLVSQAVAVPWAMHVLYNLSIFILVKFF